MTKKIRECAAAFALCAVLITGVCIPDMSAKASDFVSESADTIGVISTIHTTADLRIAGSDMYALHAAGAVQEKEIVFGSLPETAVTDDTAAVPSQEAISEEDQALEPAGAMTSEGLSEEEKEWQNKLFAVTDDYLDVYASADADSEVIGKIHKGDVADVTEVQGEWTHITSGNVDGYVETASCVTGSEAMEYARTQIGETAEVNADRLNVRAEASTASERITTVSEGMLLQIDSKTQAADGWAAIIYNGKTCYVSMDYVTIGYHFGTAVTLDEEKGAMYVSDSERTLLAAIIECEAGGTGYEGCLAVASVVLNRVSSDLYPDNIYDVIYQRSQFSPASSGFLANVLSSGSISATSYQAADDALAGARNTDCLSFNSAWTGHSGTVIGGNVFF